MLQMPKSNKAWTFMATLGCGIAVISIAYFIGFIYERSFWAIPFVFGIIFGGWLYVHYVRKQIKADNKVFDRWMGEIDDVFAGHLTRQFGIPDEKAREILKKAKNGEIRQISDLPVD